MENINVKALVQMVGINEHTLRAWERRYKAIEPERDENGRRLYSSKDLERLKLLARLVERGHTIGNIAALSTAKLKQMAGEHEAAPPSSPAEAAAETEGVRFRPQVVAALRAFDLQALSRIFQEARIEMSQREIVLDLFAPLMAEVGRAVDQSALSIVQEHILSSYLRDLLGQIYQSLSPYEHSARAGRPAVAFTTRESDIHEFGIYLSAILAGFHGYRTYYLGPNLPVDEAVTAVARFKADHLVVGLAELPEKRETITASAYLAQLDKQLPKNTALWFGGGSNVRKPSTSRKLIALTSFQDLDQKLLSFKS